MLCGYEFIRSPSTSLYIGAYGASKLPYAMLAGAIFTMIFLYGYGLLLTWIGPRRTLLIVSIFSCFVIILCYIAVKHGSKFASGVVYAFREAYIVVVIEQYWSLINSTLKEKQAKLFNGFICGVGSIGAIAGGYAIGHLADKNSSFFIGTEAILLLAAASLLPAALCSELSYHFAGEPAPSVEEKKKGKSLALSLFVESSYLRRIALLIFLTQMISTVLDLRFFGLVEESFPITDERTAFTGSFYAGLNLAAGILQFVIAPILLYFVSLRFIHPSIPIIHVATALVLFIKPNLFTGGLAYLVFKAVDYSIFRAGKEIFYIPLSFDSRYRAKEVIDAFGYRASKGISAGLTSIATMIAGFFGYVLSGGFYPATAAVGAIVWLLTVTGLVRQHDRILKQSDKNE